MKIGISWSNDARNLPLPRYNTSELGELEVRYSDGLFRDDPIPTAAAAKNLLFNELPVSCAETLSSVIDSELYYKRACSQMSVLGCRKEEHVSYKRMFFELRAQDRLQSTITLPRSIAENIFSLKLSGYPRCFPLEEVCCQLPNLNRIDVKYNVADSSHDSLERVRRR
jgi:hypothetical protein